MFINYSPKWKSVKIYWVFHLDFESCDYSGESENEKKAVNIALCSFLVNIVD